MSTRATVRVFGKNIAGQEVVLCDLYKHHDGYVINGLGEALISYFKENNVHKETTVSNEKFIFDFSAYMSFISDYKLNGLELTDNAEYHSDTEYFYEVYPEQKLVTVKYRSFKFKFWNDCCHWKNQIRSIDLINSTRALNSLNASEIAKQVDKQIAEQEFIYE